ncbi:MAG TPA: tetratricopeptide repeat protein [Acidimicrobiales bacterium]
MTMTEEQVREHMAAATAAYQAEEWSRAADMFTELLLEPEALSASNEMHWNIAMCMAHMDNFPLALEHVAAGGYSEQQFRDAMAQSNLRDAQGDYEAAVALYDNQQWEQACQAFAELVVHPGYPSDQVGAMHWNMAMCFAHMGNWDTAIEHVRAGGWDEQQFRETAAQSNLRDAEREFREAVALYESQQWEQACQAFAELLNHPGYPADQVGAMHWNMAMCFAQMGQWDRAFEHVREGNHDESEFRRHAQDRGLTPPDQGSN